MSLDLFVFLPREIEMRNLLVSLKKDNGFTLIELSIVILIVGILVAPLLQLYQNYLIRKEIQLTKDNVTTVASGIPVVRDRYPCPSDRSLGPQDANFGREQCNLAAIPLCSTAGLQGICRVQSAFDRDNNGTNDEIVIGGVPLVYYTQYTGTTPVITSASTKLTPYVDGTNYVDAWDNKLTYAVVANVMNPDRLNPTTVAYQRITSDFKAGVISAIDENGNPTAGINDNALFVIVSHGKDGLGSFSRLGRANDNCPATARGENCDEDTTFMQGIFISEGTTPYDDISKFYIKPEGELWVSTGLRDPGTAELLPHIRNTNIDNVGVNLTTTPSVKLEVGGAIRADSLRSNRLCGPNTTSPCFNTTLLDNIPTVNTGGTTVGTGDGICPNGQVVLALSQGRLTCGHPTFSVPLSDVGKVSRCPAPSYISGVYTNGCVACNNGVRICPAF
jgi:prepilin-type N-terminal cleavage/methylation domain-containing protein